MPRPVFQEYFRSLRVDLRRIAESTHTAAFRMLLQRSRKNIKFTSNTDNGRSARIALNRLSKRRKAQASGRRLQTFGNFE